MNKKIQKTLTRNIVNQIYLYNGGIKKETLYEVLEATDGVTGEIFDIILEEMIRNEECIVEKIHNLKNREIEVIFITNKGLEYVTDKNISIKTILKKKLTYGSIGRITGGKTCRFYCFESEFGKKILADLGIEGNYEGIGHCAIGYAAAPANAPAPRKDNYVYYVR